MNEHMPTHDKEPEASLKDKMALVSRARQIAPFRGQPVDRFGSFVTNFNHAEGEGFTSIYIPGLSGVEQLGPGISDSIQIIRREPEELDASRTLVHLTSYAIHETDFSTEYKTDIRIFDTITGKEIRPQQEDLFEMMVAHAMERHLRAAAFTASRLDEVNAHLDTLDPEDTFQIPEASSS